VLGLGLRSGGIMDIRSRYCYRSGYVDVEFEWELAGITHYFTWSDCLSISHCVIVANLAD